MSTNTKIDDIIAFIRIEFQDGKMSEETANELIRMQEDLRKMIYCD
ncbi:MAG: hypothetical protein LBF27_25715 [Sphingobacterium sp.]|jgi:hypothetical protein|nr:hypothetical protein [Sphingobacterium sp.]